MHKLDLLYYEHLALVYVKCFIDFASGALAKEFALLPEDLLAKDLRCWTTCLLDLIYEIVLHLFA